MDIKSILSAIGTFLKNSGIAILRGQFLMKLDAGRYFLHIVYCFALIILAIWISLGIDSTMTTVENNKDIIFDQESTIAMKTYEVTSLERRSGIEQRLAAMGSKVQEAKNPPIIIE